MRLLLVEDEKYLAEALEQILKKNNYSVDLAYDGEYGLDCAQAGIYDVIMLDIMLPKKDGLTVLKELRQKGVSTPVILLTAKGETDDKVTGLDCGADDYLAKPFEIKELLARLRALGRRSGEPYEPDILSFADIELNPQTLSLSKGAKNYILTLKECQLLELLIKRRGVITSKEIIIEKLWGFETEAEDNHAEVYVSFLRKKLAGIDSRAKIQTLRGAGYMLKTEGEA